MIFIALLINIIAGEAVGVAPGAAVLGITAYVSDDHAMEHYQQQQAAVINRD